MLPSIIVESTITTSESARSFSQKPLVLFTVGVSPEVPFVLEEEAFAFVTAASHAVAMGPIA